MNSTFRPNVISGFKKETYVFRWKMEDFALIQQNQKLVDAQKLEIQLGSDRTKWIVGLKVKPGRYSRRSYIHTYCSLVHAGDNKMSEIPAILSVGLVTNDAGMLYERSQRLSAKPREVYMGDSLFVFNDSKERLVKRLDFYGAMNLDVTLTHFVQVTF